MVTATHIVKVRGMFDRNIWDENKLRKFVRKKIICDLDGCFHAHLELFKISDNKIDVWIFIFALPSEVERDIIDKWIKDHIKEEGITVENFEFDMLTNITEHGWKDKPFVNIPWISFDDMDDEEMRCFSKKIIKEYLKT